MIDNGTITTLFDIDFTHYTLADVDRKLDILAHDNDDDQYDDWFALMNQLRIKQLENHMKKLHMTDLSTYFH